AEPRIASHRVGPLRHVGESRVIEQFAPAHLVVTRDGEIVHFSTRTGKYLENAPGAPSRNAVGMARRGLRLDLRGALSEAVETRRPVRRPGIRVEFEDRIQVVDIAIEPLPEHDVEPLFLVIFCDVGAPLSPERMLPALTDEQAVSAERFERDL